MEANEIGYMKLENVLYGKPFKGSSQGRKQVAWKEDLTKQPSIYESPQ